MSGTQKARFLIGSNGPLEALLLRVMRARLSGDWPSMDADLNRPFGDHKSGLHGLREGLTAMAKLAKQEVEAAAREAGSPLDPSPDPLRAKMCREWALVVVSRMNRLGTECPPGIREDLAAAGRAGDIERIKRLAAELEERLECLGSNSEVAS